MASEGANYCTSGQSMGDETLAWSASESITGEGGGGAMCLYPAMPNGTSPISTLRAKTFGFSIPTGATVDGIVVEMGKMANLAGQRYVEDTLVRLLTAGGHAGDDKKQTGVKWQTSTVGTYTYGGEADAWNAGLAPADVNHANFGVDLKAQMVNLMGATDVQGYVDYVRVTVHYTAGGSPASQTRHPAAYQPLMTY